MAAIRAQHRAIPTTLQDWARTESYLDSFVMGQDEVLETVEKHSEANGLPDIAVAANQGKFLYLLAKGLGVKRYLEVGTLGGYSTIWIARALPKDGKAVTLEIDEHTAKIAEDNWKTAGVSDKITLLLGSAAEILPKYQPEELFDLVFVDADKENNPTYWREAKRLVRKGGVIIVDNVVRYGRTADLSVTDDSAVEGIRAMLEIVKGDDEVEGTILPTVGAKGYDGFLYAIRK